MATGYAEFIRFKKDVGQAQARENAPFTAWDQKIEKPLPFSQGSASTDRVS